MEKVHIVSPRLLTSLNLNQFGMVRHELPLRMASFDSLELKSTGAMKVSGYSEIPGHRSADLVLFTKKKPGQDGEIIFAFCSVEGVPHFQDQATKRDHEWLTMPAYSPDWTARWSESVAVFSNPDKADIIDAWAFDAQRMKVYRINDRRLRPSRGFPHGVFPNSDPK